MFTEKNIIIMEKIYDNIFSLLVSEKTENLYGPQMKKFVSGNANLKKVIFYDILLHVLVTLPPE